MPFPFSVPSLSVFISPSPFLSSPFTDIWVSMRAFSRSPSWLRLPSLPEVIVSFRLTGKGGSAATEFEAFVHARHPHLSASSFLLLSSVIIEHTIALTDTGTHTHTYAIDSHIIAPLFFFLFPPPTHPLRPSSRSLLSAGLFLCSHPCIPSLFLTTSSLSSPPLRTLSLGNRIYHSFPCRPSFLAFLRRLL